MDNGFGRNMTSLNEQEQVFAAAVLLK